MKNLKRIINYAKPFWLHALIVVLMIGLNILNNQAGPWIFKNVTDQIVASAEGGVDLSTSINVVKPYLIALLCLTLISVIASRIREKHGIWLDVKLKFTLLRKAFDHMMNLHIGYFETESSGSVMSKIDRGVNRILGISYSLTNFFLPNLLSGLISLIILVFIRWEIAVMLVLTVVPYAIINTIVLKKHVKLDKKYNKLYDRNNSHLYEVISSMRLVKGFGKELFEMAKLNKFKEDAIAMEKRFVRMWDWAASKDLIMNSLNWCIYAYVIWLTFKGELTIGSFFLIYQYMQLVQMPIRELSWMFFDIKRAMNGATDYFKIMDTPSKLVDAEDAKEFEFKAGKIEFNNIKFAYKGDEMVFEDLDLTINPGETVAFVGKSGSGKTTIANLLMRFYDVNEGTVKVDDQNVKEVTQGTLREYIGIVMQDSYLFDLSIRENLKYGKEDFTEEEMINACKAANAHEFIEKLEKGYDTKLGERGTKLSGGQKQRLSIARTLLKNPPILILDEATSALDSESEAEVQKAIWNLVEGRTTLIIAHRLSTIQRADRIVVLGSGGIVEQGSHDELLKKGGVYSRLHEMQTGKKSDKILEEYELK